MYCPHNNKEEQSKQPRDAVSEVVMKVATQSATLQGWATQSAPVQVILMSWGSIENYRGLTLWEGCEARCPALAAGLCVSVNFISGGIHAQLEVLTLGGSSCVFGS
jgi:hypothetical protein